MQYGREWKEMALQRYMLGLIFQDIGKAAEFYRRLGRMFKKWLCTIRLDRRRIRWALLAVALIICTSCVTGPPPSAGPAFPPATVAPPSSRSVGPAGPRILGTVSVTGAVNLNSTFSAYATVEVAGAQTPAPVGSTCAEYAQGFELAAQSGSGFDAPEVQSAEVDRQTIYVSVQIASGYSGPGTYDSRRNSSFAEYASQDELNPYNPSGTVTIVFMPRIRGFTSLKVKADGSGVLQLTDWTQISGAAGGGPISVSITWTCQQ
jgi:hypothetical protein